MADNAVVHSSVHLGTVEEMDGFGIAVEIKVEGVDEELMKAAHEVCLDSLMNCRFLLKNGFLWKPGAPCSYGNPEHHARKGFGKQSRHMCRRFKGKYRPETPSERHSTNTGRYYI